MGRARDEAGNIWETDAAGNPVRMIQAAQPSRGRIFTLPQSPKDIREQQRQEAADRRAERADQRAEASAKREQEKFEREDTMAPPPGDSSRTGEDYLATIPPSLAAQVRALSDGRRAFPTGAALRSPAVQQLVAAAQQYDPTLDAANAATRVATRKDFTSGKAAQNITAINTALGHLGTLSKAANELDNRSYPIWNAIANTAETQTGDKRVKNFTIARDAVANELMRVFRGTGGSLAEIEEWKNSIGSSDSPEQLKAEIGKAVELLNSRLEALGAQYNQGMSKSSQPIDLLNDHAQKVFQHLGPGGDGMVPPGNPAGPTGPNDPTGTGPQTSAAGGSSQTQFSERMSSTVDSLMNAGASLPTINAALAKQGFNPLDPRSYAEAKRWMKDNPGKRYFGANISRKSDLNLWQQFAGSAPGAFLAHAADMATAGVVPALAGEKARGALDAMAALHPDASTVGDVVGGVAGAGGMEASLGRMGIKYAPRVADTIYGGLTGFNQAPEGDGLQDAALGAGAGLAGGYLGQKGLNVLGRGFRGVTNPAVQRLRALGIPLTAGEVLGGGWKKAQDALTSVFGPGDMVARRYGEGRRALNEVAFNEGGNVIDTPISATGPEGIDLLNTAKSNAYSQALDPISLNIEPAAFEGVIAGADAIPAGELAPGYAGDTIRRFVNGNISPEGTMTGPDFQKAYRGLAQRANKAAPKVEGDDIGEALGQAKDILTGTLQEQNPAAYEGFLKANSANRHLSILRDAVGAAKNQEGQLFTPAQLNNAAFANTAKFSGKTAAAMGDGPFQQLATDAQQVMSSKIPDSGTAKRLMMLGLATGGSGAGGYGLDGGQGAAEGGLGTMLLLAAGGSRPAQRIITNLLVERPAAARKIGDFLVTNSPYGSVLGAGTLPLAIGN